MKKIIGLVTLITIIMSCGILKKGNTQTVVIQTNAECGQCKERIETELNYVKGVRFAELKVETKELTVKFNDEQLTLQELRTIVTEIGYNADELKANPSAQKVLPTCCKPGGMEKTE